jgi:hypothetical protein
MKLHKLLIATLAFVCGQALAVPTTWTDSYDPTDIKIPPTLTFNMDITDGIDGYNAATDAIFGFVLSVSLRDDGDFFSGETAYINLPGILGDDVVSSFFTVFLPTLGTSLDGLLQLNASGLLTVSVSALSGDFFFDSATLTAWGNHVVPAQGEVPEPGSLLLLGAALSAATFAARRRKQ